MATDILQAEEEYAPFVVEQRGIDYIPESDRHMRPSGLAWMWTGTILNVEFFFYGVLIMGFGLTIWQAVAAVLLGNLTITTLAFASLQGPQTGTTAFMISRAPFGQNGNRLPALFNWLTQVGYEIEGIYFFVATVILLFSLHGIGLNGPAKIGVIIGAALLQMIIPFFGHATLTKFLRYIGYVLIVFFVILAYFTLTRLHLGSFHAKPASFAVWTTALVVIISTSGIGWTENANDYSRYLPSSTPMRKTFWAATLGAGLPTLAMELLGVLAFTITSKTVGITQLGVPQSFPAWFVTPFLILALPQLLAGTTLDMYSSSVTMQAIGVPVKRWGAVLIDTVVCSVVTGLVVFHGNFGKDFAGFLLYSVIWLSPWFAIMMTDWLLRKRSYAPQELQKSRGGLYWRNGGVHWPGVIALVAGIAAGLMWINAAYAWPPYIGPISNHFPGLAGGDFSWLIGLVVGGGVYWLLARKSVPKEVTTA